MLLKSTSTLRHWPLEPSVADKASSNRPNGRHGFRVFLEKRFWSGSFLIHTQTWCLLKKEEGTGDLRQGKGGAVKIHSAGT